MKSDLFKIIGGILLCIGTSIGGGILALPIATAPGGFVASAIYLLVCWLIMMGSAFLLLEVTLAMPQKANLITMAHRTLGKFGAWSTIVVYLTLLYTLVCAYLSGGADVTHNLFNILRINLEHWQALAIFFLVVGSIVISGMRAVDLANRFIMFFKMSALLLLIIFGVPSIKTSYLLDHNNFTILINALTVIVTSFGYAIIIPTLRTYFNNDVKKLRLVVFFGSFIPFIIYVLWEMVIFGLIPPAKLTAMAAHNALPSDLLAAISSSTKNSMLISVANLFTTVTVFTSFFGVSISLIDFLVDGLDHKRFILLNTRNIAIIVAFLPPILMALYFPRLFQVGIMFAGISVILLLVVLPVLMWLMMRGRGR